MTNKNRFSPLWLALSAVVGIFIGTFYANHFGGGTRLSIINSAALRAGPALGLYLG